MSADGPPRPPPPPAFVRLVIHCARCGGRGEALFPADVYTPQFIALVGSIVDGSRLKEPPGPDAILGRCFKCRGPITSRIV